MVHVPTSGTVHREFERHEAVLLDSPINTRTIVSESETDMSSHKGKKKTPGKKRRPGY